MIAYKGFKKSFEKDLDMSRAPSWIEPVGRIGWIGKGPAYGVIGVLVGLAAVNADPEQSGGMDKALHTLAEQPYGMFLLACRRDRHRGVRRVLLRGRKGVEGMKNGSSYLGQEVRGPVVCATS